MTEPIQSIRDNLNAPRELVEAVAKGKPYRTSAFSGDSKRRHVQRFSAAIAAYVCMALLLVTTVTLLPSLFEDEPKPADTDKDKTTPTLSSSDPISPEQATSPESLFNALLSADQVIVTRTETLAGIWNENDFGSTVTVTYTLDGQLMMAESHDNFESLVYYDFENRKAYAKYDDADWVSTELDSESREEFVGVEIFGMLPPDLIEDKNYELQDGKYIFTEKAIDRMLNELRQSGYLDTITLVVGEEFETEVIFEPTDDGAVWCYRHWNEAGNMTSTEITVEYADTEVTLPDFSPVNNTLPYNRLLTPSEFMEALCGGEDMTVSSQMWQGEWRLWSTYLRDGDKVLEVTDSSRGDSATWYDFAEGKRYDQPVGADEWTETGEETDWQSIVNSYIIGNGWELFGHSGNDYKAMFDDDNFTLQDGRYVATDAFQKAHIERKASSDAGDTDSADCSCEIWFAYENGEHTFCYRFYTGADGFTEMLLTLTFGDTEVVMPV